MAWAVRVILTQDARAAQCGSCGADIAFAPALCQAGARRADIRTSQSSRSSRRGHAFAADHPSRRAAVSILAGLHRIGGNDGADDAFASFQADRFEHASSEAILDLSIHPPATLKESVMPRQVPTHQMIEAFRGAIMNGGISAAADALGLSQPSVSRTITELQKLVGFQLFVKHGRTVRPTEEALALMTKVHQSFLGLEDIARFSEQLRKQRMGRLSICAIPAIGHSIMPEAIQFLRQKYQDVVVSLDVMSSIEVFRRVRNRQADVGFAAHGHGLAVGEVEIVAEYTDNCFCIAQAGKLPREWDHVDMNQLSGRSFVALKGELQNRLEVALNVIGVELVIVAESSQSITCSELVMRGVGISVVDPFTGALHRRRGGAALPLRPDLPFTVHAMALGDTRLSPPVRHLLQYLKSATHKARDVCQQ